jgi:hypothetical protein
LAYTIWIQLKTKVLKGDFRACAIAQALADVLLAIPKIRRNSNRLTLDEYERFLQLEEIKLYWKPEN